MMLLLIGGGATARAQSAPPSPECGDDERFANTWYFGSKAGLDFNGAGGKTKPKVLTDGKMTATAGAGVVSDGSGKILLYSNGDTIWNVSNGVHTPIANGLGGSPLVTDGPLIIRKPTAAPLTASDPTSYLIFTQDVAGGIRGLRYSEIIVPAGGGPATVVATTKATLLVQGTTEKMTGVFHKNGCDVWVIVHGWGNGGNGGNDNRGDSFLAFKVTKDGVQPPIRSTVGSLHAPSESLVGYRGQMKVTPDGTKLAVARFSETLNDNSSSVELFDFDASDAGTVSNLQTIDSGEGGYYGVEFSPSRGKLYATVLGAAPRLPQLLQFDISVPTVTPAPKKVIEQIPAASPINIGSLQAAPDGKIYVARQGASALGIIVSPDSINARIPYDTLNLGGRRSGLGLVNFNQSSLLRVGFTARITGCKQLTFEANPPVENPSYLWTFEDGSTSTVQNPPPRTYEPGRDYIIKLKIEKGCFCRKTEQTVRVPDLPKPGAIAGPEPVCEGTAPARITSTEDASSDGGLPIVYQWELSPSATGPWTNVTGPGATGETYLPPNTLPVGITYFRRRVQLLLPDGSGPYCTPTFTEPVAITVLPALTAGTIAASLTVCAGGPVAPLTSTTPATGGAPGPPAYQWEISTDGGATWGPAPGSATGETYTPPSTLTIGIYSFRRQVSSGPCEKVPSNVVTITVTPALTAGTIAANQAICFGAVPVPLTSTAAATGGNGPITYQWESSGDNVTWVPITNATNATYQPVALTVTTSFRRRASSGAGCAPALSNVVTITVAPVLVAGTIAADQSLCKGATPAPLTSTGDASGGQGAPFYQWEFSTDNAPYTPIPGETNAGYAPGPLNVTTSYRRQATAGACGPAVSNVVTLTVLPELLAGTIAADQTICANTAPTPLGGNMATGGAGNFAYQWESSTNNTTFTAIGGGINSTYQPAALTATTYFRRRVTSGTGTCSTAVSNVVTITVTPLTTPTVTLATPPTLCPGTPLTFTAVVTDAGNAPTFRWFVNNIPVASGPTFTSSTVVTGDQVRVEVTATAGLCSTGPATATVTVTRTPTPAPTLTIAVQPNAPVCQGEPLTFSATSVTEAGPNPVYQWQVNGTDMVGAIGPVFTSTTLRDGQVVTLRLSTTNSCGQPVMAVSNGIVVRIQPPVKISAGPDKEVILGNSVVLEGTADGTYPVTWTPTTGLDFSGNDPLRPTASPKVTTTYKLSAGAGGCASFDEVTVTVREAIRIPNAFTPNGDGRDDTWQIEFIEDFPNNTVTVFNRWGNEVFSAQNYSRANEWNGTINGKPAPVGTYYYVVVTKGPLGKSYSGSLTVLY